MRKPLALMIPFAVLVACSADVAADASPPGSRTFAATGFRAVALSGPDDAVVRIGPAFSVRATGPQAVLDNLEIEVRDGELRIRRRKGWSWNGNGAARIEVTLPALSAASIAGSGEMVVGPVRGASFTGEVAGSGTLTLERVEAEEIDLSTAGSGDIKAQGRAVRADYSSAGSGDIDAARVLAQTVEISTAGAGSITAHASGRASASVVGAGDVTIRGTTACEISRIGSGDVDCAI